MGVAKELIYSFAHRELDGGVVAESSTIIAKRRATAEAKEGINAFLEKRKAEWVEGE
jgi:methylglutaconyl-CoA hydratase